MEQNNNTILFQEETTLPCALESMAIFSERLDEWFEQGNVPLETGMAIHICIDEMMSNIVYYSEADDIRVKYMLSDKEIYLCLTDNGLPFDPLAKDTQIEKPEKGKRVKIGGLGIAMVRKMVKKILYQYENGKNQLELFFSL